MRTREQSKRRLSNEKLPGHDSYDDKTALQGWSFSAGEFSNNACTPYLWACDIHVIFCEICRVKLVKQECSCKSSADIASPTSPFWNHTSLGHCRFVWLHGTIEGSASLCKGAHVKGHTPKKEKKKKHTQQHSSCLAQWFLLFLPQTSGFLGSFFTIDRYLCEQSQVLIIHRFLFTTKKMVKPHGGTTWADSNRALFERGFYRDGKPPQTSPEQDLLFSTTLTLKGFTRFTISESWKPSHTAGHVIFVSWCAESNWDCCWKKSCTTQSCMKLCN